MDVPSHVERLSAASAALVKKDMADVFRGCEVTKEVLKTASLELVAAAQGSPILTVKSSDGTPITVVHRTESVLPSGEKVVRTGRGCSEYLVKNQFFRYKDASGQMRSSVMLQEPIPMSKGKTKEAVFAAQSKDWVSLRQLGHRGICVEQDVHDRALAKPIETLWKKWHMLDAPAHDPADSDFAWPVSVFRLLEWVVCLPCALHDAHNSYKWAMMHRVDGAEDLNKNCYICIESLRNSWNLISGRLDEWVCSRLEFVDIESPWTTHEAYELWSALGVEVEACEVLADMQLHFADGRLRISKAYLGKELVEKDVAAVLQAAWRFIRFSDSRYGTEGLASRGIVVALLLGIEDLVDDITMGGRIKDYYLGGFRRLSDGVRLFFVESSIISRVSEACVVFLQEEPRVALAYRELWALLSEEMRWLIDLPDHVWEVLAFIARVEPAELKSDCIHGGHISFHFFYRRVLQPAGQRPWALCRGDVRANLVELRGEEDRPEDYVTCQVWLLLRAGYPFEQIVDGVLLLAECVWTNLTTEQQHASLASLVRLHPDYTQATLTSRAFMLQLRRLMPSQSRDEKDCQRLQREIAKVSRKQPEKAHGRHAFAAALFEAFRDQEWTGRAKPEGWQRRIIAGHHTRWAQYSERIRMAWEHDARQKVAGQQEKTRKSSSAFARTATFCSRVSRRTRMSVNLS